MPTIPRPEQRLFNETCHVENDPQGNERQLWEGVL